MYIHIDKGIIEWDEVVNIGIAKHYASWGKSGLYEPGRPGFYPFVLSVFQVLGFNILIISKVIAFLSAVGLVLLLYFIPKKIFSGYGETFSRYTGFFAVLVFVPTQIFLERFHFAGTDIFPVSLIFFVSWLLLNKKYFWAGILSACIFITRFPHAIYIAGVAFAFLLSLLNDRKDWKYWFSSALKYGAGVILLLVPFFLLNYYFFIHESANWAYAAFRPIWEQSRTISIVGELTDIHHGFYFLQLLKTNPFLLLGILGFVWCAVDFQRIVRSVRSSLQKVKKAKGVLDKKKEQMQKIQKRHKNRFSRDLISSNKYLVVWSLLFHDVFIWVYHASLMHKEPRFALAWLPVLAVFAGFVFAKLFVFVLGRLQSIKSFKISGFKFDIGQMFLLVIVLCGIFIAVAESAERYSKLNNVGTPEITEWANYFKENPIKGTIIVTDPTPAVFLKNKLFPAYYLNGVIKATQDVEHNALMLTSRSMICQQSEQATCIQRRNSFLMKVYQNNNLVYFTEYAGVPYFIFSNVTYLEPLPKDIIPSEFRISKTVDLSNHPRGRLPIVIILEDFPSIVSEQNHSIWKQDQYDEILDFVIANDIPVSISVIPDHLQKVTDEQRDKIKSFAVIQNGYYHEEELFEDYDVQKEILKKGKDYLEDVFSSQVTAFIPPYYSAGKDTDAVLNDLGFEIYVTNLGDRSDSTLNRYNQRLGYIENWNQETLVPIDNLLADIQKYVIYDDDLVFSYYYYFSDNASTYFQDFYAGVKSYYLMNIYQLFEWENFISQVEFGFDDLEGAMLIEGPDSDFSSEMTLDFFDSGNYSVESIYNSFFIQNPTQESIDVCLNELCFLLESDEIKSIHLK
ncbi:DUF2334 domain-containing protein [Candidatus Woesearchaeota archaeon]|nr:DUF2334 domain-containing protein [Candidatus Woesearchaeota archaeon]